ncbi:hypothetical protein AVEN_126153-1 [Araneus ventricosus]|uniref:DUF5641 domain-containing protein n=1 Tax=Araneus ventricosus TaxID=182803 RepID=A0A4Y2FPF4_ARAVE|nr:hypothetical protein AVEN_126153-1 [Araneus ventricosus]
MFDIEDNLGPIDVLIRADVADQVDEFLNKRIKYRQQLITGIWKRFRSEVLGLLILRNEHKKQGREIKFDEVVLIGSGHVKCTDWPLGVVIELLPAKDGVTRLVCLQTYKGELVLPVQRIFLLGSFLILVQRLSKGNKA